MLNSHHRRASVQNPRDGGKSRPWGCFSEGVIHLVQVLSPASVETLDAATMVPSLHQAQSYLASVAQSLSSSLAVERNLDVSWSLLFGNNVARTIIETAEGGERLQGVHASEAYDLIALSTHGLLGFQLLARGSVAEQILAKTRLPVFVLRPQPIARGKQ